MYVCARACATERETWFKMLSSILEEVKIVGVKSKDLQHKNIICINIKDSAFIPFVYQLFLLSICGRNETDEDVDTLAFFASLNLSFWSPTNFASHHLHYDHQPVTVRLHWHHKQETKQLGVIYFK